uniref:Uncharacterized protein n=1 Tax=Brassica oleracea var. oleracea TaxID=109376 RepID=A0A0D2ZQ23_BRAOL
MSFACYKDCPWVIFATTWVIFTTTWVIFAHEDCPWVIFATTWVIFTTTWVIFAHEDCPWVIFATTWVIFTTTWVIFAHEDCPWVIFATRTVRQYTYQHVGPVRGLSVGDFRPRGLSVSTHISTLAHPVDCPGDFRPRGLSVSTHISTLALPVDYPWVIFAHEDCPWVIFAHEDCPSVRISARWPFPWTIRGTVRQYAYQHVGPSRGLSVGDFRPRGLSVSTHISTLALPVDYPWVIFAHEDCPSVRISARWPFPWTIRGTVRQYAYQHVGPSRGLSVGDFRPRGLSVSTHISTLALPVDYPWVIFAHEDCPSVRISARWPFPWTIRG